MWGWLRRVGAGGVFIGVLVAASARPGIADPTLLPAGSAPVVIAQLRSGTLTIRTWQRPQVRIVTAGSITSRLVAPAQMARRIPAQIPLGAPQMQTPRGPLALPPEPFVVPPLSPGAHTGVVLRGDGNTVATIPATAALLVAHVNRGTLHIAGYRNGAFVAIVRTGSIRLQNVAGTGAAQVLSGRIIAQHSNFTRLQARTGRGNLLFHNCNASQIEVTSIRGSILYDHGTFQPGLARFQSQHGDIALGIASGGVQLGAQSASGRVVSVLPAGDTLRRGAHSAQATLNGGGPVVTATSGTGSVFLYRGALRNHPQLRAQLQQRARQRRFAPNARRPAAPERRASPRRRAPPFAGRRPPR